MREHKKSQKMNACNFIFPPPRKCVFGKTAANISRELRLDVEKVPEESLQALYQILKRSRITVSNNSRSVLRCEISGDLFKDISDEAVRNQAYQLEIAPDNQIILQAADIVGIRYGITSLSEIFAAAEKGAVINVCRITDSPAFAVRGVQLDMAREFFPSMPYLKKIVDRLEKMKANTLWLYIENRFNAEGMKDISPSCGMTAAKAREISEYASARGIDVVPGINVLSHMEGWFRLQRYSEFCDGDSRTYPVLTKPEALKIVLQYIDSVIDAFPSKNFHAGLDELLFTETNPEAADAIQKLGKAEYFANFAIKVIKHIQDKGKTVWMWDDMVLGKNIYRQEGFNDTYRKALDKIPNDVIMTHWYYWTNADGKHTDIIKRVTESGRPFVVAPSSLGQRSDYTAFDKTLELQAYIAECGFKYGAFGFINTHWESRKGHFFESLWPHLAVSSAFAWYGPEAGNTVFFAESFSFNLTGDTGNALMKYLEKMSMIDSFLDKHGIGNGRLRYDLYCRGPHFLWRFCSPLLSSVARSELSEMLDSALAIVENFSSDDPDFKKALFVPLCFFRECLNIIEEFDQAYTNYHQASLAESENKGKSFEKHLNNCYNSLDRVIDATDRMREQTLFMQKKLGHTPYDAYALKEHCKSLKSVSRLIKQCVLQKLSLPYFEKLLYLPEVYFISNMRQLEIQNTFHNPFAGRGSKWLNIWK